MNGELEINSFHISNITQVKFKFVYDQKQNFKKNGIFLRGIFLGFCFFNIKIAEKQWVSLFFEILFSPILNNLQRKRDFA